MNATVRVRVATRPSRSGNGPALCPGAEEQGALGLRLGQGYRANLMRKLGLRNQTDLVWYALQGGLLPNEAWIRQRKGD
jgi:hypothetical protein